MQVIIKKEQSNEDIINVIYGKNTDILVDEWINNYMNIEIESLKYCPNPVDIVDISYSFESENNIYTLIKTFKNIKRGYIYNTSSFVFETIFKIHVLSFDESEFLDIDLNESSLEQELANIQEINNRIMKDLSHNDLYEAHTRFDTALTTKEHWLKSELILLKNQILKEFKKELYSGVVKRMKKFNKKQAKKNKSPQLNDTTTITDALPNYDDILNERSKLFNSCKTEYTVITKQHFKQD
jgi:hypothetical protein